MDELIAQVQPYTRTNPKRMWGMIEALQRLDRDGVPGDVVECGVWRGGSIMLARKVSPERVCWLYDTFTGMSEPTEHDKKRSGRQAEAKPNWMAASRQEVEGHLRRAGVFDEERLHFVEGKVEDTLRDEANLPARIALLRLDTDFYESTKAELEVLWPRLEVGGALIVDDYHHWMGAKLAVDEFFGGDPPAMKELDYSAVAVVKAA